MGMRQSVCATAARAMQTTANRHREKIGYSRKLKKPWLLGESVPPTAVLMAATSALGPPMSVVPVSIAESAALPVEIVTGLPFTVTPVKGRDHS